MNRKKLIVVFLFTLGMIFCLSSCKKDVANEPLEPISLIKPDSSIIRKFPGDIVPIEVKFTTDRPINWIKGMYDIDSLHPAGYVPTYPDTLFFEKLDAFDPRVNIYTYSGSYAVLDSLNPYDVVRFKISFEAGNTTFTTGQNYPAGKVSSTKEFRIDVR